MIKKKTIFAIIGSASAHSANQQLVEIIAIQAKDYFDFIICPDLKILPLFDADQSTDDPPPFILTLRKEIEKADGILICTPEYVFSIPAGLKNLIEWCVATTVFSDKPTALLTASSSGQKGHEALQLIMKTLSAKFTTDTTLLIQGIKGKVNEYGQIIDTKTSDDLVKFVNAFKLLVTNSNI
jgi:NAD(P)H-dependent FMN reductase